MSEQDANGQEADDNRQALEVAALLGDHIAVDILGMDRAELRRLGENANVDPAALDALTASLEDALDLLSEDSDLAPAVADAGGLVLKQRTARSGFSVELATNLNVVLALFVIFVLPRLSGHVRLGRFAEFQLNSKFPASLTSLAKLIEAAVPLARGAVTAGRDAPAERQPSGSPEAAGSGKAAAPQEPSADGDAAGTTDTAVPLPDEAEDGAPDDESQPAEEPPADAVDESDGKGAGDIDGSDGGLSEKGGVGKDRLDDGANEAGSNRQASKTKQDEKTSKTAVDWKNIETNNWKKVREIVGDLFQDGLFPTYGECIKARNDLFDLLNSRQFIETTAGVHGKKLLTGKAEDRESKGNTQADRTWRQPWSFSLPLAFGVGLIAYTNPDRNNAQQYTLSLRVQAGKLFMLPALGALRGLIHAASGKRISIRALTPAVGLVSNPTGEYRPWQVRPQASYVPGLPLNIAGGGAASSGWMLIDGGRRYVLTAGHALGDGGRGARGNTVYTPPQPMAGPLAAARFGTLRQVQIFPKYVLGSRMAGTRLAGVDHAWVELDERFGIAPLQVANQTLAQAVEKTIPGRGARVVKAAGKTREAWGRVEAVNLRLPYRDCVAGHAVLGDDLVEIELEEGHKVLNGDSGSLLCLSEQGLKPLAMLVAGARSARLSEFNTAGRMALYGVPLVNIPALAETGAP